MTRFARRAARPGLLALLLVGLAGCAGGKADVSGKVTYKGKPVTSGSVIMIGSDDAILYGTISPDGTYTVTGVTPGLVKIGVSSPNPADESEPPPDNGRGPPGPKKPKAAPPKGWMKLPPEFAQPDTSKLSATLNPGANTHNVELN